MQWNFCYYIVAANRVIAHPGQDVELICQTPENMMIGWLVDSMGPFKVDSLHDGILDGYSASTHTNSIIILNIMMNDSRNGTKYRCGITSGLFLEQEIDAFILYVTGELQ